MIVHVVWGFVALVCLGVGAYIGKREAEVLSEAEIIKQVNEAFEAAMGELKDEKAD